MTSMIEVKTAELSGPALDWAVGIAEGWEPDRPQDGQLRKPWRGCTQYAAVGKDVACADRHRYTPSTDWRQGGPLIEKDIIELAFTYGGYGFYARHRDKPCDGDQQYGETALIAACRAIVAAKLGDTVRVPAALVGGEA